MSPIPAWGVVCAAPHERLLHLRRGRVLKNQQGGSCFKWPGDTVARVDTSIRRLQFTADQVTRERVGVAVTGLAVFRVVQPLLAFRMLNLDQPQEVEEILGEMLLGATRRLVANLTLEQCLTRRKDALAAELMAEIAPVVQGSGRESDDAEQGWGLALDTIEIQDVRVLSTEVFERLQAGYREALALEALAARAEVEREEARLEAERVRDRENARRALMALEEERLAAERERQRREAEHRRALAWAEAESRVGLASQEAEAQRLLGEARAEAIRREREATAAIGPERLQELLLTETLPRMAEALRGSVQQAVLVGGGEASVVAQGVAQIAATLQAFGLRLPGA